ncbi:DUF7344 domain-containing protein [Halodesulfurarchaeum formicicum]|uniref:DUF7344 domain-containing protein n=1 Tax=Halodesulfurarchaeum formicicum TaxID=1873524 RepID=A0A1J1AC69_9EURY|nr:hypothetical protein [Halodesulfurarchaeum formicicum]APE95368.1 hypothetical protein HSR6_0915 [Halodesulfurarchaeum formicicum]
MPTIRSGAMDPDTAFSLLSNQRRRHVLCLLAERGEAVPLSDVATEIASRMNDVDPDKVEDADYRSVYVALYQNHVPRLAEAGVVEYDDTARTARIARNQRTWELLQYAGVDTEKTWECEYLLAGVLAVLAAPLGMLLAEGIVPAWWMYPVLVLIAALALIGTAQATASHQPSVSDCHSLVNSGT